MDDASRAWADRTGEFSPRYYAHRGQDDTSELLRELVAERAGDDARVLELGCSAGRHLAHFHDDGFADLVGVDVNEGAHEVMVEHYPDLADAGTFHYEPIQDAVERFDDDAFDAVFSVQTLQHIPPEDEWVYDELARIASELLVTVETEQPSPDATPDEPGVNYVDDDVPLYYRDWETVFEATGCEQMEMQRRERDTVRVFEPPATT